MPFVPAPNCASVELIYTSNGQRCENVFNVSQASPFDQVSLAVLAALFKDWFNTELKMDLPGTVTLDLIVAKALDSESAPAIEFSTGLPIAGNMGAWNQLPNNVTVAVRWSTELRGRSYRGRTYHIALSEEQVSGNTVDQVFATAILGRYEQLLDDLDGLNADLVVLSRFHNGAERTTAVATPINRVSLDRTIDSQRRRLPGRGS